MTYMNLLLFLLVSCFAQSSRPALSTDCGNDYVLVGETHAEVEPECDQFGCPEVDSCDACKLICDDDSLCAAFECNALGDKFSCSFNGHLTTTEECGPLCESQTVCVKNSTQIDGANFVSADSNNRRKLWPLVGGPQNPVCYSGFEDRTNGNAYWWGCGASCPGGQYWTDYLCRCACQEESQYSGYATSQCYVKSIQHSGDRLDNPVFNGRGFIGSYTGPECAAKCDDPSNKDKHGRTCVAFEHSSQDYNAVASCALAWGCDYTRYWSGGKTYIRSRRALASLEEENFVQVGSRLLQNERKM